MFGKLKILFVIILSSFVFLPSAFANQIYNGYYEMEFFGEAIDYCGSSPSSWGCTTISGIPVKDSSSAYAPLYHDSVYIHFGADLYTYNAGLPSEFSQFLVDDFELSIGGHYVDFDLFEGNGDSSNFDDEFDMIHYSEIPYDEIDDYICDGMMHYDFDSQSGNFYIIAYTWDDVHHFYFEADLTSSNIITQPVPEPATILLLGSGFLGVTGVIRKKRKVK